MKKFVGFIMVVFIIALGALMVLTKPSGAIEGIKNTQVDYMMATTVTENNSWKVKCYKKVIGDRYVETSLEDYISDSPMIDAIEGAWKQAEEAWNNVVIGK